MMSISAIARRALDRLGDEVAEAYRRERREAALRLHGAIADAIAEQKPTAETILYVLEVVRSQVMAQHIAGQGEPAAEVTQIGLEEATPRR